MHSTFRNSQLTQSALIISLSVADLQRGMGGPLHGPEGTGGPERAPMAGENLSGAVVVNVPI